MTLEGFTLDVNGHFFDSLVGLSPNLEVVPELATSWESPDERTWIFRLRTGVRFSDGTPLTARDVVASIRYAREHGLVASEPVAGITAVEADGDARVVLRTREPSPLLLTQLQAVFVLPAAAFESGGPVPPVGSGPYAVEGRTPGRELRMRRNPKTWWPASGFERVRLVVVPDERRRVEMLLSGEAGYADDLSADGVARLSRSPDVTVRTATGLRVLFLAFRVDRPPFSDSRLRRAVALAVDRGALVAEALQGFAEPATQIVPGTVAGFDPAWRPPSRDVAEARRLLAEAGFPEGISVRLDAPTDRYVRVPEMVAALTGQLAAAGIRATPNLEPKARYFARLENGDSDFWLLGYSCTTLFGGDALSGLVLKPDAGGRGRYNWSRYHDALVEELVDEAYQTADSRLRNRRVAAGLARIQAGDVFVPLVVPREAVGLGPGVAWKPARGVRPWFADVRPLEPRG